MPNSLRLSDLDLGKTAEIIGFSDKCNEFSKSRLISLGFTPGESVTPDLISPLGEPTAYLLGSGAQIALRRREAEYILID